MEVISRTHRTPHSTGLTPVRNETTADRTVDKLLTAIALGEFTPGDRLPSERELSVQLQVSRATVREASRRLREIGVVDVRRGRSGGSYIREPLPPEVLTAAKRTLNANWSELSTLLDMRSLVEGLVAATAAERHTELDRQRITALLDGHATAQTAQQIRDGDSDLHHAIAEAAGNPHLHELRTNLAAAVGLHFGSEPYLGDSARFERARREHRDLAEAIFAHDAARASQIARAHFEMNIEAMSAVREDQRVR